jgi:hypothetical protein
LSRQSGKRIVAIQLVLLWLVRLVSPDRRVELICL